MSGQFLCLGILKLLLELNWLHWMEFSRVEQSWSSDLPTYSGSVPVGWMDNPWRYSHTSGHAGSNESQALRPRRSSDDTCRRKTHGHVMGYWNETTEQNMHYLSTFIKEE